VNVSKRKAVTGRWLEVLVVCAVPRALPAAVSGLSVFLQGSACLKYPVLDLQVCKS